MIENPDPSPQEIADHHIAARAQKRAMAGQIGIDDDFIAALVENFYATIRADALLGPIFAAKISDWPLHLGRMKQFWRSILLGSGEYSGNPMAKHVAMATLDEAHFAHWLELFYATLRSMERENESAGEGRSEATARIGARARMIADSLLTGITIQRTGLSGARAGEHLPFV